MALYIKQGDLLTADVNYICHQVNCQGKMNSGIAKSIREKYPKAYIDYMLWYEHNGSDGMFNNICVSPVADYKTVIHMASQYNYGYDGRKYTSYDAFWTCLHDIANTIPKGSKIGFPGNIGCCRGGANWNVILEMIKAVLAEDFEVYIYFLED